VMEIGGSLDQTRRQVRELWERFKREWS
jgi:hypothetical protein